MINSNSNSISGVNHLEIWWVSFQYLHDDDVSPISPSLQAINRVFGYKIIRIQDKSINRVQVNYKISNRILKVTALPLPFPTCTTKFQAEQIRLSKSTYVLYLS